MAARSIADQFSIGAKLYILLEKDTSVKTPPLKSRGGYHFEPPPKRRGAKLISKTDPPCLVRKKNDREIKKTTPRHPLHPCPQAVTTSRGAWPHTKKKTTNKELALFNTTARSSVVRKKTLWGTEPIFVTDNVLNRRCYWANKRE